MIPELRVTAVNAAAPSESGRWVVYWMTAARRSTWNWGLQRAADWAAQLGRPLLLAESLGVGGDWDTDRSHAFALQGMADQARRFRGRPVTYYPFVEREPGESESLLRALGAPAAVVVTDDYPDADHRKRTQRLAGAVSVRVESVDSNGVLPLRAADRAFPTAYSFRRFLQRTLPDHLASEPLSDPLAGLTLPWSPVPSEIASRWPAASLELLAAKPSALASLPVDHTVPPGYQTGGTTAAEATLVRFVEARLSGYAQRRNHPDLEATSELSAYLRWGHLSAQQVLAAVAEAEDWTPALVSGEANGARQGWWGMGESAEVFLDQLVTWRELGYNMAHCRADYRNYESLPPWAQRTLTEHSADPREYLYDLETWEESRTHDLLWNAAQRQLVREGRLHNYLRMLWGKKILEWSAAPEQAWETMVHLNNRYGLDGSDPNSCSGIAWVLGRYDRAWGPERRVFGKIRYMSAANTARKVKVTRYLRRYAAEPVEEAIP